MSKKIKANIVIIVLSLIFSIFQISNSFAKTEYDTFYYDYPIIVDNPPRENFPKIKYEIKISKFKKPTKTKCSKVTVKVKRLNAQELNTQLTQEEKGRIRDSLVIFLISADFFENKKDGLMRRTAFVPQWEGLNDKTVKVSRCLTHKWDTSGMKSPMTLVLDGVLVSDLKLSFVK